MIDPIAQTPDYIQISSQDGSDLPYLIEFEPSPSKGSFAFGIYYFGTSIAVTGELPLEQFEKLLDSGEARTDFVRFSSKQESNHIEVEFPGTEHQRVVGGIQKSDVASLVNWLKSEP